MIIFISGSINSGKSTVAKLLALQIPNTALLEIDSLREMVFWMQLKDSIPLNLENAISLIKNFVKKGMNVVVPYPLSEENYIYLISELTVVSVPIHFITLSPTLAVALSDRGTRLLSDAEKDRIKYHYSSGIITPSFGKIIDNSKQTPEETVQVILNSLTLGV